MWDSVLRTFRDTLEKAEASYLAKAKSTFYKPSLDARHRLDALLTTGFDCTDEENALALASLRKRAWLALRAKVDEQTADSVCPYRSANTAPCDWPWSDTTTRR